MTAPICLQTRLIRLFFLWAIMLMACSGLKACAFGDHGPQGESSVQAGLFSWNPETVNEPDEALFAIMEDQGLDALYQEFSLEESSTEDLGRFFELADRSDVDLYYLTGNRYWGLDSRGTQMLEAVEEAVELRSMVREGLEGLDANPHDLRGIVFDVEPYITDEWDADPDGVMRSLISGSTRAYDAAKEQGLEVIICIPWYYEEETSPELLEKLVSRGCDHVAVMNYYRGEEVANIATEAEIARKYGKGLITIYELQYPNDYNDVEEINTYWNEGVDAVWRSYDEVKGAYPHQVVSVALHDYRCLWRLLNR